MTGNEQIPILTFKLANQHYALPIENVLEVAAMLSVSRLPNAPQEVLGIVNRHGEALLMLDLRLAFQLDAAPFDVSTLFIVAQHDEYRVGLVVDEIYQVRYVDTKAVKAAHGAGMYIKRTISSEQMLYQEIDLDNLLQRYMKHIQ